MNTVIIYEHCNLALKAYAMLESATHPPSAFQWNIHPWKLEAMLSQAQWDLSLSDAAKAHLIVFAIGGVEGLSPQLLKWLEMWAERRLVPDAALAIFDSGNGRALATPLARGLRQFADRHGLSLLVGAASPMDDDDIYFGTRISQHFLTGGERGNSPRKPPGMT